MLSGIGFAQVKVETKHSHVWGGGDHLSSPADIFHRGFPPPSRAKLCLTPCPSPKDHRRVGTGSHD